MTLAAGALALISSTALANPGEMTGEDHHHANPSPQAAPPPPPSPPDPRPGCSACGEKTPHGHLVKTPGGFKYVESDARSIRESVSGAVGGEDGSGVTVNSGGRRDESQPGIATLGESEGYKAKETGTASLANGGNGFANVPAGTNPPPASAVPATAATAPPPASTLPRPNATKKSHTLPPGAVGGGGVN